MLEYIKIDQTVHQLCQIIAKVNRTFVPKVDDDSHTNLYYDYLGDRILGRWIKSKSGQIMLGLNLSEFVFSWFDNSFQILKSYEIAGKNSSEIETSIEADLEQFGLNKAGFRDNLHFIIEEYSFKNDRFDLPNEKGLTQWRFYRNKANKASLQLLGTIQQESEIRIWPHHFDTGIYAIIPDKLDLSFGLAMKDEMAGSPYFYISGYPSNGQVDYLKTPTLSNGVWITGGEWEGAILKLSNIKTSASFELDYILNLFIKETVRWYLN